MAFKTHGQWLKELLNRDPVYQALVKRRNRELYEEAQRILEEGAVNWLERSKENAVYHVAPVIYEVKMVRGKWFCECRNFSHYNVCEHIPPIQIQEGK